MGRSRTSCTCQTSCGCTGETSPSVPIQPTTSQVTLRDRWDHFLARWGVNRSGHIVTPGIYRLGNPSEDSPVFASANYTLSFDALRNALEGIDTWILVLDTKGVNVWCAAGKGTFGTSELVRRIDSTGLAGLVKHRKIILPQLAAPGVSAHEVSKVSGFVVEYGPVRACDLPAYLKSHTASREMRTVQFTFMDRLVLTPVEFVSVLLPLVVVTLALYFLAGLVAAEAAVVTVLTGTVLFPILLPYIPTQDFSMKGFILGAVVAMPFAVWWGFAFDGYGYLCLAAALVPLFIIPSVVGYLALNFTGSTPFTSRTGVKTEIFQYVPLMMLWAVEGVILGVILGIIHFMGMV